MFKGWPQRFKSFLESPIFQKGRKKCQHGIFPSCFVYWPIVGFEDETKTLVFLQWGQKWAQAKLKQMSCDDAHVRLHRWNFRGKKGQNFIHFISWATTFSLHSNSLSLKLENCLVLISSHDYPKKMILQKVLWQSVLFLKWALRKNSLDHNHWRGINRIFRLWIVIKDQPRVYCCWDYGSVATGSSARGSKKKRKTAQ